MEYLTTKEAAHRAGLKNDNSIRRAILRGKLQADKFGHIWRINAAELERWLNEERHTSPQKETIA